MGGLNKNAGWISVCLALIVLVPGAAALDLPDFKSLGLPSFRYGKLKRDREVNNTFQTYKVLPGYKYYTTGQGKVPNALIGIQDKYKLRLGMWKKVQLTTPLLRSWVSQMDNIYGYPPYGSIIFDNEGRQIGIWYSSKQWTTILIEDNNEVAILAPEPPGFRGRQ